MFVEHFGVKLLQFVEQYLIFVLDVVGIARHHEQQKRITFDVTQKAKPQTFTRTCTFYDARNVGHHE